MNVIRPKMQLSGGFAPVSLQRGKNTLDTFTAEAQQLPVIWGCLKKKNVGSHLATLFCSSSS